VKRAPATVQSACALKPEREPVPAGNGERRNQSPTWRDACTLHPGSPPDGRRPSFNPAQHGRSDLAVVRV